MRRPGGPRSSRSPVAIERTVLNPTTVTANCRLATFPESPKYAELASLITLAASGMSAPRMPARSVAPEAPLLLVATTCAATGHSDERGADAVARPSGG